MKGGCGKDDLRTTEMVLVMGYNGFSAVASSSCSSRGLIPSSSSSSSSKSIWYR
ncbi:glycerol-3-phosphate dehydrogenase 1-like protein isoform X1 [Anopheles sinensis]|uniref:Glycerol-3-phosphate dehydrogenase 1-like protein isoform X1 n=1 Tax=Anopheles sinensis TaxID=74873 RepID=A0A084VCU3_ANOSI|nr:glycerol-3-phosphate dehydrogenase 1-like protein isoform X1 [Anopheles sinensis]